MASLKPTNRKSARDGAQYSLKDQLKFVKTLIPDQEQWWGKIFPSDPDQKIPKLHDTKKTLPSTPQPRRDLSALINITIIDYDYFTHFKQQVEKPTEKDHDYVATVQLATIGMAPLIFQLGHIKTFVDLAPELQYILMSPKVRKMIIGFPEAEKAFYHSFGCHLKQETGYIDLRAIAWNRDLKPFGDAGNLDLSDFARLVAFQFWGPGVEPNRQRKDRLAITNHLARPDLGIEDEESKAHAAYEAWLALLVWHWIVLNNPDALLTNTLHHFGPDYVDKEIVTANRTRRLMFLPDQHFAELFWPKDKPSKTKFKSLFSISPEIGFPLIRDLKQEKEQILTTVQGEDRDVFQEVVRRYLEADTKIHY